MTDLSLPIRPNDSLVLFITQPDGSGYEVDLREFAHGGSLTNIAPKARHVWRGDFKGRPNFAAQLAELYEEDKPSSESSDGIRSSMRNFYRFLDHCVAKGHADVMSIREVTDSHGLLLSEWSENQFVYRACKTTLDRLRQINKLPRLFWPARSADPPVQEPVDAVALRRFFHGLKHEARAIKRMFKEGDKLASRGRDPRRIYRKSFAWLNPADRAWIIKTLTSERLLSRDEFKTLGAYTEMMGSSSGPKYLAPAMTERGREGLVGALRWFYPSYQDTAVFLWIFLVGTGWNLSTALSLDVTEDATWFEPHPHSESHVVIRSFKRRANASQFALSMTKPEWHPFRTLKFMIERTTVLRATVRYHLEIARRSHALDPSPQTAAAVAEFERVVRSPWLYHTVNKTGRVSAFGNDDTSHLGPIARAVSKRHGLLDRYPALESLATSDARDAWIGYAYVQSGYHVLITQLASQHKNIRVLKHYLKARRYRERSEKQVHMVQNLLFSEISNGRIVDPTRLRLLVSNGTITPEQEKRLSDLRQRTRLGMGCLDPTSPPREVAPEHQQGSLCRIQRCTGCQHGIVFAESLGPLARAYVELTYLMRDIPLVSWSGSSLEEELASIEDTLKTFSPADVAKEIDIRRRRHESGEIKLHETYPSY